jgi:hypothetical protein
MSKNHLGRPALPKDEKVVRGCAPYLLPAEWEKLREKGSIKRGRPLGPLVSRILREWIERPL